ncbi:hypothetical protein HDE_05356 [Halotydeus destructor]|nr:hypothetical protein HDE_05356 [Halotydeus destructor]
MLMSISDHQRPSALTTQQSRSGGPSKPYLTRSVTLNDVPQEFAIPANLKSKFDPVFSLTKYLFIILNLVAFLTAFYLLYHADWNPDNSLVILGLIFGAILSVLAMMGSLREESYLVLTYAMCATLFFLGTLFHWVDLVAILSLLCYLVLCFFFAFLLYRKAPPLNR